MWAAVNVAHIESPRHTRREAYNVGIWACGLQAPRCGTAAAGEPFLQRVLRVFCGLGGRWAPVFKWVFRPLWFSPRCSSWWGYKSPRETARTRIDGSAVCLAFGAVTLVPADGNALLYMVGAGVNSRRTDRIVPKKRRMSGTSGDVWTRGFNSGLGLVDASTRIDLLNSIGISTPSLLIKVHRPAPSGTSFDVATRPSSSVSSCYSLVFDLETSRQVMGQVSTSSDACHRAIEQSMLGMAGSLADALSLHCPLPKSTHPLLSQKEEM